MDNLVERLRNYTSDGTAILMEAADKIVELQRKIDGMETELSEAVNLAFNNGATDRARLSRGPFFPSTCQWQKTTGYAQLNDTKRKRQISRIIDVFTGVRETFETHWLLEAFPDDWFLIVAAYKEKSLGNARAFHNATIGDNWIVALDEVGGMARVTSHTCTSLTTHSEYVSDAWVICILRVLQMELK